LTGLWEDVLDFTGVMDLTLDADRFAAAADFFFASIAIKLILSVPEYDFQLDYLSQVVTTRNNPVTKQSPFPQTTWQSNDELFGRELVDSGF